MELIEDYPCASKEELNEIRRSTNIKELKTKFNHLDDQGNILGTYRSPTEAAEILFARSNAARRSIEMCIKGERLQYKGNYFKYVEE